MERTEGEKRGENAKEIYKVLEDFTPSLCKHDVILKTILADTLDRGTLSLSYLKQILELEQLYQRTRPPGLVGG